MCLNLLTRKNNLLYFLLLLVSCTSTDSDSSESKTTEFDTSVFWGEWCNFSDGTIVDLTLSRFGLSGMVYTVKKNKLNEFDNLSGMWLYFTDNNILEMSILHSATGHQASESFKVISYDSYTLNLRNQELGVTEVYNKVVETRILKVGEKYDIDYLKKNSVIATNYTSSNPSVVKINSGSDTVAEAAAVGVAFISVSTNVGTLIVKVEVR